MIDYEAMARYADERLPRYTSYPTAPLFSSAVAAPDYRHWLAALPPSTETALSLHIPFCRSMCWYCGCHTTITRRDEPISNYIDVLQREIELVARHVPAPLTVRHVHFGGGTPTTIEPEALRALVARLRVTFHIVPGAEIAVEIDPRTLTPDMMVALGEAGFTRASLGVQSFDPRVQKEINRIQSVDCTAAAVDGLRAAGIRGINFDLIYGLPLQTTASCVETVEQCLALQPDRFSVFGYAHVPKFKKHQRKINEASLPGGHARHDQATAIADVLVAAGFVPLGPRPFAPPRGTPAPAPARGPPPRNLPGYPTGSRGGLIRLGAPAICRLPPSYLPKQGGLRPDPQCVLQGELAAARGYRLTSDDILRADLIERLMCDLAVDVAEVCARHGITPATLAPALIRLRALANEGIVHIDGARIVVADHARPLVRTVASTFDAYLGDSQRLYSRAV